VRDSKYKQKTCRDGWERKEKEYIYLYIDKEISATCMEQYLEIEGRKNEKNTGIDR
jgi:hypothetical protein